MRNYDSASGLEYEVKRPGESRLYDFDFTKLLSTGETIASVTSVTQTNRGNVAGSSDLTIGAPSDDGASLAQARISAGTDGEDYCLEAEVVTSGGNTLICAGYLYVRAAC